MGTVLDGRWWCDGVALGGRVVVTVVGDPEGQSRTYMTTTPATSPKRRPHGEENSSRKSLDRGSRWPRDRVAANDQLENEYGDLEPGSARHVGDRPVRWPWKSVGEAERTRERRRTEAPRRFRPTTGETWTTARHGFGAMPRNCELCLPIHRYVRRSWRCSVATIRKPADSNAWKNWHRTRGRGRDPEARGPHGP